MTEELKDKVKELSDANQRIDETKSKDTLTEVREKLQGLKEANDLIEQELLRQEELKAKIMMGGRANAGYHAPEKSQEELDKEEAAKILSMFK